MILSGRPGQLTGMPELPPLPSSAAPLWQALVAAWHTDTRLYHLASASRERPLPTDLMVESFILHDAVSEPFVLYLNTLVLDAHVELKQIGRAHV